MVSDSTLKGPSRAIASLQSSTRYYWRVQAVNATGSSPWSEVWSFTTREPLPLPATVILKSPLADATIPGTSVLLLWRPSGPEVTRYWMEYSTDATFATSIVDSTVTDTTATRSGLIACQRY